MAGKAFIATKIDLVDHAQLVPADYNPREMDDRTLRVLVRSLARFGWVLPVVANRRTGNIVGGHQRCRANAHILKTHPRRSDYRRVPVIYVDLSAPEEKALNVALNQISGDWDFFKKTAADELRQNATFAQMTRKHHALSRAYRAPLGLERFDFRSKEHFQRFVATFGTRILDFGCGRGQEVEWLKSIGVHAIGFEPFRRKPGRDALDISLSQRQADGLLGALADRFNPQSVFCNFVISSIARPQERAHVLTILQALGRRAERVMIAVRSQFDVCYQQVLGRVQARKSGYLGVPDSSEPGLIVTGAGTSRQKFQKFFTEPEFVRLLKRHFAQVKIVGFEPRDSALVAVCTQARPVSLDRLSKALRFEFEVPINGAPLARSQAALRVFRGWMKR